MVRLRSKVEIELYDKEQNLITRRKEEGKLIVDTGFRWLQEQIGESVTDSMIYSAIGTDNTTPAAGQTALGAEVARGSGAFTSISTTQFQNEKSFTGLSATIVEAGLFNASSGGAMLDRVTFGAITLAGSDELVIRWSITLSEA